MGYTYDTQGRMRTMTTWQTFSTGAGAATTRWNYDAYRGWLKSKDYPDKSTGNPPSTAGTNGPTYEYTAGGRLKTRTWLRGLVTTYTYGFSQTGAGHGDLVGVTLGLLATLNFQLSTFAQPLCQTFAVGRRLEISMIGVRH